MELELLTYDGSHAGFCEKVTSGSFSPKYRGTGHSEYRLSSHTSAAERLMKDPFLLIRQGSYLSAVIGHKAADTGHEMAVFGRTLSFFTEKTLVPPVSLEQKTVNEMLTLVLPTLCGVPFTLSPDSASFSELQDYTGEEYVTLQDFLERLLSPVQGGYEVTFSQGALSLVLLAPRDTGRYLSVSDGNAVSVTRTYDLLDRACGGYRRDSTGAYRFEGTPDEVPMKNWYTLLKDSRLEDFKSKDVLDAETRRLFYGRDYRLGDTFTVQFENEKHLINYKRMITGVTIDEDKNGYRETPLFEEV